MDIRILPECYVNTALTTVLGYKKANHKSGVGDVLNALASPGYNNSIGIGLIDRDKQIPRRLRTDYQPFRKEGPIEIKRMGETKRFVIIHPVFERWTYEEGNALNIRPSNYGLPGDFSAYKDFCKRQTSSNDQRLRNFLNDLVQSDSELKILATNIDLLIQDYS